MSDEKEKSNFKKRVGVFIIANAIVWCAVIISTSLVLRGTGYMSKLIPILGGGASVSVVILSGGMLRRK
jgi:hypothetical protein